MLVGFLPCDAAEFFVVEGKSEEGSEVWEGEGYDVYPGAG